MNPREQQQKEAIRDTSLPDVSEEAVVTGPVVVEQVRERYGNLARAHLTHSSAVGCCGADDESSCCAPADTIPVNALAALQTEAALPAEIIQTSLGCGTPLEIAELKPGEVVLDLGSGGGLDCFYAAKLVGARGRVIGVDMTPEMLELANANRARVGLPNVEFRRGYLEALPLDDASVDVIISNCVINLSTDKDTVFREAFRVLKPGGRVALSDMVSRWELPAGLRKNMQSWAACVSGAITPEQYREKMEQAGFVEIGVRGDAGADEIVPSRSPIYSAKFIALKPASDATAGN